MSCIGSVFADFAKYGDESFARAHSKISLHARSGQSCELSVVAVDVVDASCETMCPSFDDAEAISKQVAKSDIVFREYDGASKVFAFATCSYQTVNSRTVVYAVPNRQADGKLTCEYSPSNASSDVSYDIGRYNA